MCSSIEFPAGSCRLEGEQLICDHPVKIELDGTADCEVEGNEKECEIHAEEECDESLI